MTILVKCECGKRFPVNPNKHVHDDEIKCPFCGFMHKNNFKDNNWKPNEEWHKNKHISKPFDVAAMRRSLEKAFKRK
jgi:hypothetical protein